MTQVIAALKRSVQLHPHPSILVSLDDGTICQASDSMAFLCRCQADLLENKPLSDLIPCDPVLAGESGVFNAYLIVSEEEKIRVTVWSAPLNLKVSHTLLLVRANEKVVPTVSRLSKREMELFELFGSGLGNTDIARKMHVSEETVRTYKQRIRTKLECNDITSMKHQAALWAAHEWIDVPKEMRALGAEALSAASGSGGCSADTPSPGEEDLG